MDNFILNHYWSAYCRIAIVIGRIHNKESVGATSIYHSPCYFSVATNVTVFNGDVGRNFWVDGSHLVVS